MTVAAWILSGFLASVFLGAGLSKLVTPHEKLVGAPNMAWAADFSSIQVKAIGALETLGAVGVVLPWLLEEMQVLTPVAAVGLAIIMIGAALTHARRGELRQMLPINGALFVLAAAVALIRFAQLA